MTRPADGPVPDHLTDRVEIDVAEGDDVYRVLTSVVLPRPIAWVSTTSSDGVDNLAPHSFFTVASARPPILAFTSIGEKDTLRNVLATGEFVVSMVTEALREQANVSATAFGPHESEYDATGLAREPSARVRPPRVAASPVALECRLETTVGFGESTMIFGRVVHIAVDAAAWADGRARIEALRPMSRLGGDEWAAIGEVWHRRRMSPQQWAESRDRGDGPAGG